MHPDPQTSMTTVYELNKRRENRQNKQKQSYPCIYPIFKWLQSSRSKHSASIPDSKTKHHVLRVDGGSFEIPTDQDQVFLEMWTIQRAVCLWSIPLVKRFKQLLDASRAAARTLTTQHKKDGLLLFLCSFVLECPDLPVTWKIRSVVRS